MSADDAPTSEKAPPPSPDLQFDRVDSGTLGAEGAGTPGVACAVCKKPVGGEYYTANGKPICADCRAMLLSASVTPRSPGRLVLAGVFGFGAMLAGAAVYYLVEALLHVQIGIIAILVGYMVGYAVRKGAGGRGGRRFQILAVVLTYCSIDLAYAVIAAKQLGGVPTPYLLVLPIVEIFGSLPYGLISALIIFIGLRQAWVMTAPHAFDISGPYKVGAGPTPAST